MSTGETYTADGRRHRRRRRRRRAPARGRQRARPGHADTDGVTKGEAVTAVGDGNGTVDYLSAATGTVIATHQSITTQGEGAAAGESLTDLIQISSDVVGGYSGGATYDADGEVVGMTTAASSGTTDIVGYAIPISTVLDHRRRPRVRRDRRRLRLRLPGLPRDRARRDRHHRRRACTTARLPPTPGSGPATPSPGSAGPPVTTSEQLGAAIAAHEPGDRGERHLDRQRRREPHGHRDAGGGPGRVGRLPRGCGRFRAGTALVERP